MIDEIEFTDPTEKYIYWAAILQCSRLVKNKTPIKDAVKQILKKFSNSISNTNNLERILYQEVTQEHELVPVIKGKPVRNQHWWDELKEKNFKSMKYWRRYNEYLMTRPGWSIVSANDIDISTDAVMNALVNPTIGVADERRGLVYGDVQSGKTAHYISLINKAFCAGYRIIIVLAGMQNSLRSQTQSRIDEEVLGFDTSNGIKKFSGDNSIGVGIVIPTAEINDQLQSLTTRDEHGDFTKNNSVGSYMPPYIIVTKKVKSPLQHVISSLTHSTITKTENGKKIIPASIPALIIDDEADQASINTNNPTEQEEDPTTINGLIRKLLNLFQCKSYVGYTATPFANIFIPHRVTNDIYGKDLFPKDFIAKSPRPNLYIGAREFFGLSNSYGEALPMPLIRIIKEGESFLPKGTHKDDSVGPLPIELKRAVQYFIISTAVRNLRGQRNKPNTMLVHIVRYVYLQKILKRKLREFKDEQFNYIKYGDPEIRKEYENLYLNDYLPTEKMMKRQFSKYMEGCTRVQFNDVWEEIKILARKNDIVVYQISGKSTDSLVYENHKNEPFNVIVIGGDKLSRGLTLEGLTISYFTRSAGAMDTLMQMGRWFGYRPGYLDLCRLFTTEELSTKFETISYSVANLSEQFDDMNTIKLDPEHFGLKVAADPNILISSRNKIRTGKDYCSDFSGSLTQTRLLDADEETVRSNYEAVDDLLSSIDQNRLDVSGHETYYDFTEGRNKPEGKTFWVGVSGTIVANFLERYKTSRTAAKASSQHIADYIREMNKYKGVIDWTICLAGVGKSTFLASKIALSSKYGPISVYGIRRNTNKNESQINVNDVTRDLHILTSAGDEELDLKRKAFLQAQKLKNAGKNAAEIRKEVRNFDHGFLLLYPIEEAAPDLRTKNEKAPYALAVVFPDRKNIGELRTYRLNEVAVELDDE